MRIKMISAVVVLGLAISVGVISAHIGEVDRGGSATDWPQAVTLDQVVRESDAVVRGTILEERDLEYFVESPTDPAAGSTIVEVVRTVRVGEVISGAIQPGQSIQIIETRGSARTRSGAPTLTDSYEVLPLKVGAEYLFFLQERHRAPHHPPGLAGTFYTYPVDPAVAEARGGSLQFVVPRRYVDAQREAGRLQPGQQVPFSASLDDLRAALAAREVRGTGQ